MNRRKIIDHTIFFTISFSLVIFISIVQDYSIKFTMIIVAINFISIFLSLILSKKIRKLAIKTAEKVNYDQEQEEFLQYIPVYMPGANSIYATCLLVDEARKEILSIINNNKN